MHEEEGGGSLIHVSIKAEPLFHIGPFEFTNSMVGALLASIVLLAAAWYITRRDALVEAAKRIGYPVVVKPLDGNHGRGVMLNLGDEDAVTRWSDLGDAWTSLGN